MVRIAIHLISVALLLIAIPARAAEPLLPRIPDSHPRLVLSADDIEQMRRNVASGREPFKSVWQALQEKLDESFTPDFRLSVYTGPDSHEFYNTAIRDGGLALDLAIAYHISGEARYADKAVGIIESWLAPAEPAGTWFDPAVRYPNTGMEVARGSFPFLYAYDLLCAGNRVPESTRTAFTDWVRLLVPHVKEGARRWVENDYFDRQYYQNHIAADVMGLMSMGIILGDEELVGYALDPAANPRCAQAVIEGLILMRGQEPYYREPVDIPPADGEIMDRYRHFRIGGQWGDYVTYPNRALQYCGLSTTLLVILGEMGRLNGVDLYGWTAPTGENIKLPLLYYTDFYILKTTVIKSGFYAGEDSWINANDCATHALWEVAHRRWPDEPKFREVLDTNRRGTMDLHLLGPVTLTHGWTPDDIKF